MQKSSAITRRGFIGALGIASTGFRLPSIVGARDAKEAEPAVLRLHRNESPYGLPPSSAQTIHAIAESKSQRYPIEKPTALAEAIARRLGVAKEQVLLGCGSTEILKMATAAALAALKEEEFVTRVHKLNAQVRSYLCDELRAMGLEFIPSQTNFVMVDLDRPAPPVIDALKQRRVLVGRLFPSMPHHMRVTLGTGDEMKLFMKEFKEVMTSLPA